jgi:hypothetical protein
VRRAGGVKARWSGGTAALSAVLLCGPAAGEERRWAVTGTVSRWVNADLLEIPERTATGRLRFEDSNFAGAALTRTIVPSFAIPLPGTGFAFRGNRIELEGQVVRHFGEQHHWEGTLALMFRTGDIPLFGGLSVNLGFTEGFSYAGERPELEGSLRVRPRHFLNYLAVEAEFKHASLPGVAVVPRIHHRSGVFGLIAPKTSGSNFIGVGVRVDLN